MSLNAVTGLSTSHISTLLSFISVEDHREAKNTLKVLQDICNDEGISTLYRGLVPVLSSLYCSNFIYFYTFHGMKKFVYSGSIKRSSSMDLILGYFAGKSDFQNDKD